MKVVPDREEVVAELVLVSLELTNIAKFLENSRYLTPEEALIIVESISRCRERLGKIVFTGQN